MHVSELLSVYKLTQEQLSVFTGIPRHRIAKWNTGKAVPKTQDSRLLDLAAALFKGKTSQEIDTILKSGKTVEKFTEPKKPTKTGKKKPYKLDPLSLDDLDEMERQGNEELERLDSLVDIMNNMNDTGMSEEEEEALRDIVNTKSTPDILINLLWRVSKLEKDAEDNL